MGASFRSFLSFRSPLVTTSGVSYFILFCPFFCFSQSDCSFVSLFFITTVFTTYLHYYCRCFCHLCFWGPGFWLFFFLSHHHYCNFDTTFFFFNLLSPTCDGIIVIMFVLFGSGYLCYSSFLLFIYISDIDIFILT